MTKMEELRYKQSKENQREGVNKKNLKWKKSCKEWKTNIKQRVIKNYRYNLTGNRNRAASVLKSSRISNTLSLCMLSAAVRQKNPLYLSMSVSREESRKPLANGLLSIFSLVIWKTQQVNTGKFLSSLYSTYLSLTNFVSPHFLIISPPDFVFSVPFSQQTKPVSRLNMLLPAAWLTIL